MILERDKDTIAAVSTAPGTGGIAVLRISGSQALNVARKLATFLPGEVRSHQVYYGELTDPANGEILDEVLLTYFAHGRSFTGEDTVEISCHGGRWLTQLLLQKLTTSGARLAERGEFTYRAYMNGRIDLVQAEAVLALIESQSSLASRVSLRQLRGGLSNQLEKVEEDLLWACANLEANIDFAQEDIVIAESAAVGERLQRALAYVEKLVRSRERGNYLRHGFQVCLVGRPNAGKSSLLNALLQEDRAIVSEIPGTTRDFIEGRLLVGGVEVALLDTAGLRETSEMVESLGILKTVAQIKDSDLILFVLGEEITAEDFSEIQRLPEKTLARTLFIKNKEDLVRSNHSDVVRQLQENLPGFAPEVLYVSAKERLGLEQIFSAIEKRVSLLNTDVSEVTLTTRQGDLLEIIFKSLQRALKLLEQEDSPEFIIAELQDGVRAIHEILGKVYDDQVMDKVFKEFCLGK